MKRKKTIEEDEIIKEWVDVGECDAVEDTLSEGTDVSSHHKCGRSKGHGGKHWCLYCKYEW